LLDSTRIGRDDHRRPATTIEQPFCAIPRALLAQIRERSDLDETQALALAREELHAARAERDTGA
jgi:hypothetical protein